MKTFLVILLMLNLTTALAGNGVVTGDGHPVDLTKQERIDTTTVDQELKELTGKLAVFSPEVAHMLNAGVVGILNKSIILIKIPETSHDHFTFIEGGSIMKSSEIGYYLQKLPTIYFYENYFSQDENKKLKILIHEILHMYLGSAELKVQRVTDLIFKISTGDFTEKDYENLYSELSQHVSGLWIFSDGYYECKKNIGLKYVQTGKFETESLYVPVPNLKQLEQFETFSPFAQKLFVKNSKIIFNHSKSDSSFNYGRFKCSPLSINKFNLEALTFVNFVQNLYRSYLISPVFKPELTEEQKVEVKNIIPTTEEVSFGAHAEKVGITRKYDISSYVGLMARGELLERKLLAKSIIKIPEIDFLENVTGLFSTYKKLQSMTGAGDSTEVLPVISSYNFDNVLLKVKPGKYPAKNLLSLSSNGGYKDLFEDFKKGVFIITEKEIDYTSNIISLRKTTSKLEGIKANLRITTDLEFAE